ncbi:anti sigma factor C-terminal domain-containing protein [Clostridium weizhouense]|uniref:Anti-sigma factor n=1 Tax=Clostridium weizhouense TaxID=2859781 RepID=A0ABS7AT29_9CLOT|nr:anti sigma factor C-terminal domain-containing protein [Clostridium weizhouense]MBW6410625.1 anti-sigma factor [Clostridium weizhouense]
MKDNDIDNIFDDKKLQKSLKKAKLKSTLKIVVIAIFVFIIGIILNFIIGIKYSQKAYEKNEAYIELSVPNGYISKSNDIIGFLGGSGTYKISKNLGNRAVILEDRISLFGVIPPLNCSRIQGHSSSRGKEWSISLWENGYKKMRFFHPDLQYKKYQNDLEKLDNIPDGKIIEMGISFDRGYKIYEMYLVQNAIKSAATTWLWLDEFTNQNMEEFKQEIDEYDSTSAGIEESDIIGIECDELSGFNNNQYNYSYDNLIDTLNKSCYIKHKDLYKEIMSRGKTKADDAKILGAVVYGTKDELKKLIGNPIIKASSFGVIVDDIY